MDTTCCHEHTLPPVDSAVVNTPLYAMIVKIMGATLDADLAPCELQAAVDAAEAGAGDFKHQLHEAGNAMSRLARDLDKCADRIHSAAEVMDRPPKQEL